MKSRLFTKRQLTQADVPELAILSKSLRMEVCFEIARRYLKPESAYKSKKEYMKSNEDRACKACSGKRRGFWTCVKCKKAEPPDAFSKWLEKRKSKYNDGKSRCNACNTQEEEEERQVSQSSHAAVNQRRRSCCCDNRHA